MTFEHKLLVGLEEIKAIVFECNECKSRTTLSPEQIDAPPMQCPRGHPWDWNIPAQYQQTGSPFVSWLHSLRRLRDPMIVKVNFKMYLEFEGAKDSA
jgi:hypothetical protein